MNFGSNYAMVIGGVRVTGADPIKIINPATEAVAGTVPDCTRQQLDDAVAAARAAFPAWSALPIERRRAYMVALADAILAHTDPLKRLLTSEQGKPHHEAEREVVGAAGWLKGTSTLDLPVSVNEDSVLRRSETRRVPLGVVGAVVPWNFPLLLAMFKVAPALLTGNTIVLKPSPFTPLATLRIAELAIDILPPGVLNVVTGGDDLGPWITEHHDIDKVSFTGSTATGRRVMAAAASTLKRVTLELGGNDAAIVLPDADVEKITPDLFWAAFRNNGQICIATKRLYVHRDIYDRLRDALVAYARTVVVGDGSAQGTQIGPLNNRPHYDRVRALIRDAEEQGYSIPLGGDRHEGRGYFVPVTIVDNPPEESRIVQEEQFGPILPLLRYDDVDEAVRRANASEYGLGCSIWGGEESAGEIAQGISSGTVWINETQYLSPGAPFGGWKQSGLGIEGGIDGLMEYTAARTIVARKAAA